MDKRLLILTDYYLPKAYANGECVKRLVDEFIKDGFIIDLICYKYLNKTLLKKDNGINYYPMKPNFRLNCFLKAEEYKGTLRGKINHFFGKLSSIVKKALFYKYLPLVNLSFPRRIKRKVLELINTNKYYGVISALKPMDTNYAISKLVDKKLINCPWIIYCLDTLVDPTNKKAVSYWYDYFVSRCTKFFYMESRKQEVYQYTSKPHQDKLVEADIPLLIEPNKECSCSLLEKDIEHWSYFGALGNKHYKTDDLLNMFFSLPNDKKRILHFFSRGRNVDKKYLDMNNEYKVVIEHGYVDKDKMEEYMNSSDILVSLKYSDQISAKIFEYIGFKKPIIHISGHQKDPDIKYLEKYPNALIISTSKMDVPQMVKSYKAWKKSETNDLSCFEKNTPRYSVNEIKKTLEEYWRTR